MAAAFPGRESYPPFGILTGGNPMKIILVDDNPHVRDKLKELLMQLPLEIGHIMEADCGPSAIRLIQQHRPELIITDAKLLLLSEASLLDQIYAPREHGRIIVTSSHEFVLKAFCQGGIDSLLKPIGLEELESALLGASSAEGGYAHPYLEQAEPQRSDQMI